MMLLTTVLAAGALATASLTAIQAPARPRADTLELAAAVALARRGNPRLAAAAAQVDAAGARIRPAGALGDPQLQLGLMNYMLPEFTARRDPLSMNQVTLMQMVPVNGSLGLRRAIARADATRAGFARDAIVLDVERDVRARWWALYHVQRQLDVMDRTVTVLRDLAAIAATMYAVGSTPQSDVIRAQTAVTRMTQEVQEMAVTRVAAAAALNAALGRGGEVAVAATLPAHAEHAFTPVVDEPELPPLAALLALAERGNPTTAAARAMQGAAVAGERLARRMVVPDLSLGVAYGQRPGDNDMLSLMVGVSLPVFAGARQFRMRDEARAMRAAATADVEVMRLEIRAMVTATHAEAANARRQVETYLGVLLPQAEAAMTATLAAYRTGRVDFASVLDAQMALLSFQHDLHRHEAAYGAAVAELDRLIGRPFAVPAAGTPEERNP